MSNRLEFLKVMNALRRAADSCDDNDELDAFEECLIRVTGGNTRCPIGALLLKDYLGGSHWPSAPLNTPSEAASVVKEIPQSRGEFIDAVLVPLGLQALEAGDEDYREALSQCADSVGRASECPLYRLFQGAPCVSSRPTS